MLEPTGRACEICRKNDLDSYVLSSSIGGFSQNCCVACAGMGAEAKSFSEEYNSNYYNEIEDNYYNSKGSKIDIVVKSGKIFENRAAYVEHINKTQDNQS